MTEKRTLSERIYQNRTQIIVVSVILFLLEIQIFAIALSRSGIKYTLQVKDETGDVIYETDGKELTEFKKYYFEQTFGPFERYQKKLVTRVEPFPFRAWFSAAIGVPVGLVLLFSFVIQTMLSLFGKSGGKERSDAPESAREKSGLDRFFGQVSRLNIFIIGAIVFVSALSLWVIPNLISAVGRTGLEVVDRYKWFFGAAGGAMLLLAAWIVYLRYLLAKKAMETEADIRKYQIQLTFDQRENEAPLRLEDHSEGE